MRTNLRTNAALQLVLSDEIIGMVKRMLRGVPTTPETLALDVIAAVGPGGHYLDTEHTYRHFREEIWQPELQERGNLTQWQHAGSTTLADRVRAKVLRILETHQAAPLPDGADAALREIIAEADRQAA